MMTNLTFNMSVLVVHMSTTSQRVSRRGIRQVKYMPSDEVFATNHGIHPTNDEYDRLRR
jgi:hypothetical protein